jgi:hypothetical protein
MHRNTQRTHRRRDQRAARREAAERKMAAQLNAVSAFALRDLRGLESLGA